jgi:hypothetical protein
MLLESPTKLPGATAQTAFSTKPTAEDPYTYQVGFNNRFATEAMYVKIYLDG